MQMIFVVFLAFLFFLFYWISGGVFFAAVALLRLMRLRKVRFSCLFSLSAFFCAVGASLTGIKLAEGALETCRPTTGISGFHDGFFVALTCGFTGIMTGMLIWAAVLVLLGFVFLAFSRREESSWLTPPTQPLELEDKE